MQLGEEARWVEIIDEKCLKVGEVLHILQGEGEMLFLRPADTLPSLMLSVGMGWLSPCAQQAG